LLPGVRAAEALREDVRRLTAAVERLEALQRKQGEQVKKLREMVADSADSAKAAITASEQSREASRLEADRLRGQERDLLTRFDDARHTDAKWRKIFSHQLAALLRHAVLPLDRLEPPHSLNARRFRLRSQNEEDGVLLALLEHAGWGGRRFVEIGSGKSGGNSAGLAHECGWSGLLVELSERSVDLARAKFAGQRGVTAVAARVTPGNVNELLEKHAAGEDTEEDFEKFMAEHGQHFPENPRNVDELMDSLAKRSAAAQRFRNSLSESQRAELDALAQQAFGSPSLMNALNRLDANLQAARPGEDWSGSPNTTS